MASNPLFSEFFASCPDLLFIASAAGGLLHENDALREILGAEREGGSTLAELAHPEDRAALLSAWAQLEQSDEPVCFCVRLRDARGEYRPVSCNARRSRDRGAVFGSLRATPEINEGERTTLRDKARILDSLVNHVDKMAFWALDRDGICFYHDGKALPNAGLKPGQLLGVNWIELYGNQPAASVVDVPDVDANMHSWFDGTVRRFRTDSNGIYWDNWIAPLHDERSGAVCGLLGLSFDISESRRTEQELRAQLQQIEAQQKVIRDLSTPIIEVWDGVLTLPMVGTVDSVRTADVMDSLLSKIVEKQARFAILDLTGVEVVDTRVASHLIELVTAIRLLGADGIVAGIKPNVAQTMVALGLDLSELNTQRNLRAALQHAIRSMTRQDNTSRAGAGAGTPGAATAGAAGPGLPAPGVPAPASI
ncbi:STAS domain-containing protein [Sorangium sp. So ce1000]|uniref:STAS domain-containing protein n=1 Tax=Sorangium sp. So ce1000 TaxID=3133325 RepID=UPI003F620FB3